MVFLGDSGEQRYVDRDRQVNRFMIGNANSGMNELLLPTIQAVSRKL